jgi:hypothetical protein
MISTRIKGMLRLLKSDTGVNGSLVNPSYKHLPWATNPALETTGSRTLADSRGVADHDQLNLRCVPFA